MGVLNDLVGTIVTEPEPDPWTQASDAHERWINLDVVTHPEAKSRAHEAWQASVQRANRSIGVR